MGYVKDALTGALLVIKTTAKSVPWDIICRTENVLNVVRNIPIAMLVILNHVMGVTASTI